MLSVFWGTLILRQFPLLWHLWLCIHDGGDFLLAFKKSYHVGIEYMYAVNVSNGVSRCIVVCCVGVVAVPTHHHTMPVSTTCILNTVECQRCACNYNMNYCLVASHKLNRNVISWGGLSLSHVRACQAAGLASTPPSRRLACHSPTKRRALDWWRQRHVTTNRRVTSQQRRR